MKTFFASVLLVALLAAQQNKPSNETQSPQARPSTQSAPSDSGDAIFQEHCARCHGPDGSSQTFIGKKWNIPDLRSDEVQKLTIGERIEIITYGKEKMPAHERKLTAEEIKLVEAHVRELGKKKPAPDTTPAAH